MTEGGNEQEARAVGRSELAADDIRSVVLFIDHGLGYDPRPRADLVGVTVRTWNRWVTGESTPNRRNSDVLRLLAAAIHEMLIFTNEHRRVQWFHEPNSHLEGRAVRPMSYGSRKLTRSSRLHVRTRPGPQKDSNAPPGA